MGEEKAVGADGGLGLLAQDDRYDLGPYLSV